jgi:cell division transport system permease protein
MGKRRKRAGGRHGLQVVTLCISTTMVLVLLGLLVFFVLTARNLSAYVKENLTVTVMLADSVTDNQARLMCRDMYRRCYTRNVDYISKEQAQREQTAAMGADPSEFLGFNPFSATLEVRMKSEYANRDSLRWISAELMKDSRVTDVAYQEDLMDSVNNNLRKFSVVLFALAVLLTCVSFSLINSTVKLSVYSRRFLIHTMKLVGASWGFIRRPFLRNAIGIGLLAAVLACGVLGGGAYLLYTYEPSIVAVVTWRELAITGVAVFVFGIVITTLCSCISVNKFLRMSAGDLYKI